MADYKPGHMDISTQSATYASFWTWSFRVAAAVAVILALMYFFLT